jgi:hypothetical protein
MSTDDKAALDAYTEAGIELPPDAAPAAEPVGEPAPEPAATPEPEAEPEGTSDDEPKAPEPLIEEPKERKPRSIYHDLKDTRNDLKSERELREQAERERDELRAKLDGKPPVTIQADDLDAFAEEIGADPAAIKRMRELFLKDMPASTISPELQTRLDQFEAWQKDNGQAIAKQQFETEFNSAVPQLQRLFPNASKDDIAAMKSEIDTLAHTSEYHDKEIDYIAFRNQEKLATLVTPHKKGLESKGRVDATNTPSTFDPNADITKMSPKEAEAWEKGYVEMTKNSELTTDSIGRRVML